MRLWRRTMPKCTELERQWLDRFNEIDMEDLIDELGEVFDRWSKKTRLVLLGPTDTTDTKEHP